QQRGHEPDQLDRNIEHDTIRQHAEPRRYVDDLQRDPFYRRLRGRPKISGYVCVSAQMPATRQTPGSLLLRKPHFTSFSETGGPGQGGAWDWVTQKSGSNTSASGGGIVTNPLLPAWSGGPGVPAPGRARQQDQPS